jgi:hypothetical protein
MSGTPWLLISLPVKSGVLIFNLDQPDFKGEDYDLGILCTMDNVYVDFV